MAQPTRIAIYARVSTRDRQESQNQLRVLRRWAEAYPEGELVGEYVDADSGAKSNREAFERLFADAHRRRFDLVVFWALDRFSREGVLETLNYLNQLEQYGVRFVSHEERFLDSSGMFREALISILATLAKQERVRMSARVRAGMERARAQGKRISRPPIPGEVQEEIRRLTSDSEGLSLRQVARQLGVSVETVRKYRATAGQGG